MRYWKMTLASLVVLASLGVMSPQVANAQFGLCINCDSQGCFYFALIGYDEGCIEIPNGCIAYGNYCEGAPGFSLRPGEGTLQLQGDGTLLTSATVDTHPGTPYSLREGRASEHLNGGRAYERGCSGWIVSRSYSPSVGETMRLATRVVAL
jgi:hypothetical protein